MATSTTMKLAVDGGPKAMKGPWPARGLFGEREKRAVMALFDKAIASGVDFGYNGPEEQAYCAEFAEFLGGGYADAVNSGTTAVYVALRALEIEPFHEVICPPITDPGGVMPVPLCNLIPIPSDSAPGSYNAGPDQIEARITPRTRAIIVAHIAGTPAEMGPIMEIARARNLPVIEDCAQAHGATWRGKLCGTLGTIGAFSTMFGKHHATGGQGGVVFTRDAKLYQKVRWYSDRGKPFGIPGAGSNVVCSLNLNLNDLAACIGRVQLKRLPQIVATRRRLAATIAQATRSLKAIRPATIPKGSNPSYWFLFFHVDWSKLRVDKAGLVAALKAEGVPVDASYLHLFTRHDWYKNRAVFGKSGYPWASPLYKGNPDQAYPCPNIEATDAAHIRIFFHEAIGTATAKQMALALKKVEAAYLK